MSTERLSFEVLCLSTINTNTIDTETRLLHFLFSNKDLASNNARINDNKIEDDELTIIVKSIDASLNSPPRITSIFSIEIKANYQLLEHLRLKLISHLKTQYFDKIYILYDEVSRKIACEIYPLLNDVENSLRKYLIKFFVTKIGDEWWGVTANPEMTRKAKERKSNETVFKDFTEVDNKLFLVDFKDLGQIIYSQSSGFIQKEDIINKIMHLEETEQSIREFKIELQSNYTKFFKETFKDNNFQKKWEDLEKIRNKTAHNGLFEHQNLIDAQEITFSLKNVIEQANTKIDEVIISPNEQQAIENIIEENEITQLSEVEVVEDLSVLDSTDKSRNSAHFFYKILIPIINKWLLTIHTNYNDTVILQDRPYQFPIFIVQTEDQSFIGYHLMFIKRSFIQHEIRIKNLFTKGSKAIERGSFNIFKIIIATDNEDSFQNLQIKVSPIERPSTVSIILILLTVNEHKKPSITNVVNL